MNELVKMARMNVNEPLWIPSVSSPGSPIIETLNFKEYLNATCCNESTRGLFAMHECKTNEWKKHRNKIEQKVENYRI